MSSDNQIAEALFHSRPLANRERDVKTTENVVHDIRLYNPDDNDWKDVDTAGADVGELSWEKDRSIYDIFTDPEHGVTYVNWYGERDGVDIISAPRAEPERSFKLEPGPVIDFHGGTYETQTMSHLSVVYRSGWVEDFDAPITKKWFASRIPAAMYNDIGFSGRTREKQIQPFVTTRPLVLLDMNSRSNIAELLTYAKKNGHKKFTKALASTFVGKRTSMFAEDTTVCNYMEVKSFPGVFDGWIFLTDYQGHHDEIYLFNPNDVLVRERFLIKRTVEQQSY